MRLVRRRLKIRLCHHRPGARAVFNIGNCERPACAEEAAKVRARVAVHQRVVDLT